MDSGHIALTAGAWPSTLKARRQEVTPAMTATTAAAVGLAARQRRSRIPAPPKQAGPRPSRATAGEVIRMRARVGDRLVLGEDRVGEVIAVPSADGSPPYIIKWLKDGHIAMVLPDPYARIVGAGKALVTDGSGAAA
jgi:hypothetical protein